MYCDLVRPFLQSTFRSCYLGCEFNRLYLENSLETEGSPHLHPCIDGVYACIISCFDVYFIIKFLEGLLEFLQSSLIIFSST